MAMPLCGTFHYAGVVPDRRADRESGQWQLEDQSGAPPLTQGGLAGSWKFLKRAATSSAHLDALFDDRLVGLQPTLRISGGQLVLEAAGRRRAQIRSASLELDERLVESLRAGDVLALVRTDTADVGVSVLRGDQLIVAVGAVTAAPLGDNAAVRGSPVLDDSVDDPEHWARCDTWVDVSVAGEARRLRAGEETTICHYRFSVVRCFEVGLPGTYESLAISLEGMCPHEATVRSAELLARPNAGLRMADWSRD